MLLFKPSRNFGNIHKSGGNVLTLLHTFLINGPLIFNFISFIMYIEKPRNRFRNSFLDPTFIFLPLFSFRKGPELTGHQPRVFSTFSDSSPALACSIKIFMQLNVGNGYGRSAVPGFVVLKCWAQRYAAANSPYITGNSYVSPRNGHNRSLHWRIISFRCYGLLREGCTAADFISSVLQFDGTGLLPESVAFFLAKLPVLEYSIISEI